MLREGKRVLECVSHENRNEGNRRGGGAVSEGTNQKMVQHIHETDTRKPMSLLT